jgi:hypothetical protein
MDFEVEMNREKNYRGEMKNFKNYIYAQNC